MRTIQEPIGESRIFVDDTAEVVASVHVVSPDGYSDRYGIRELVVTRAYPV